MSRFLFLFPLFTVWLIQVFFQMKSRKLCVLSGNIRNADQRTKEEKFPIQHLSVSVPLELKTAHVSSIWKAILLSECAKSAASVPILNVNRVILLHSNLTTDSITISMKPQSKLFLLFPISCRKAFLLITARNLQLIRN